MAQVAQHVVEPREAALIAERLHGLGDAAAFDHRRPCLMLARASTPSRLLHGDFQVDPQFMFQVAIRPTWTQCPPESDDPLAKRGHRLVLPTPGRAGARE